MSTRSTRLPANVFTADQLRVLRAVVNPSVSSLRDFEDWTALTPVEQLDRGSQRMLPRFDQLLGADHPWRSAVKEARGRNRANYERHRTATVQMGRVLQSAGIELFVIKGVALVASGVLDVESRAMSDVDVAVRLDQFVRSQQLLIAAGWTIDHPIDPTKPVGSKHALTAVSPDGNNVDLHWNVLHSRSGSANQLIWDDARDLTIDDVTVRIPAPHDALLIACVHRFGWKRIPPLQWVTDATAIITDADDAFWDAFVDHVVKLHLSLPVCDALVMLGEFGVAVPDWVVPQLAASRRPRWTNLEHRLMTAPPSQRLQLSRELRLQWLAHRTGQPATLARSMATFPRVLVFHQRRLPLHRLVTTWLRRRMPDIR